MKINDDSLLRNTNNFDFLRFLAASFVLIGHTPALLDSAPFANDPFQFLFDIPIRTVGVFIFFTISGFLVTKSWESKKSVTDFFIARVLRIFPALIIVIFISTFILGPILSSLSLTSYFSSLTTYQYLLNTSLYRMYYALPGVFDNNAYGNSVNGSLWTLSYEFTCYIVLFIVGILHVLKYKWLGLSLLILTLLLFFLYKNEIETFLPIVPILGIHTSKLITFLLYFFTGSIFYQFRNEISFNWLGITIGLICTALIKMNVLPYLLLTAILPYFIFFFAFSKNIKLTKFGKFGDFSYGMYLYAFPIQQTIISIIPINTNSWICIFLFFLFIIPIAFLSWKYIEKPALEMRFKIFRKMKSIR